MTPDVAAVISNIIDHSERVEEQFALNQQQGAEDGTPGAKDLVFIKANSHLKSQSLPILDNLVGPLNPSFEDLIEEGER